MTRTVTIDVATEGDVTRQVVTVAEWGEHQIARWTFPGYAPETQIAWAESPTPELTAWCSCGHSTREVGTQSSTDRVIDRHEKHALAAVSSPVERVA
ncbi:MAG: hypothetical protein J0H73_03515 [Salana multivorans]|uniref:hypothetical protein n=1 Tax=Salana multivorans TaxID=120377 RepID=UPI00095B5391|nr:hypothetical protein [Salana multivorans]MBN8881366.1 hypothetical protein [Salana multivorans]OJX93990.1 MAG: hypothetical protein BGO96_09200 [Micrococcales bacterium 73-15]